MKLGIFTPVHKINVVFLKALFESLSLQSHKDFIIVLILNGEAEDKQAEVYDIIKDYNVETRYVSSNEAGKIGALKHIGCECLISTEDVKVLVEIDYDDIITETCLEEINKAFGRNEDIQYVYSNFAHFGRTTTGEFESKTYNKAYGWHSVLFTHEDYFGTDILNETVQFPAIVQNLYRIESAPNHIRAYRVSGYQKVGGYNKDLAVGDDHELVCRFMIEFGEWGFYHINKCLYYQRTHPDNTHTNLERNRAIQEQVDANYVKYSEQMFLRRAKDDGLLALDLGGRFNCPEGYKSVDLQDADYIINLNEEWWQIQDGSVGVLRAYHVLEHLEDPIHFFNEAYRVLAPGGVLLIEVPSVRGVDAFADPTHKTFWTEKNFEYYTSEHKARFIRPQFKGAFQKMRVVEYEWPDGTKVISAQLMAIKGEIFNVNDNKSVELIGNTTKVWGYRPIETKYSI